MSDIGHIYLFCISLFQDPKRILKFCQIRSNIIVNFSNYCVDFSERKFKKINY